MTVGPETVAAAVPEGDSPPSSDRDELAEDPVRGVLRRLGILAPRRPPVPIPAEADRSGIRAISLTYPPNNDLVTGGILHEISGDHLYVAELNGFDALYVKMGPASNPWVKLREGMSLTRTFSRLRFWAAIQGPFPVRADALVYVTTGPFVETMTPAPVGLDQVCIAFNDGTAPIAGVTLINGSPSALSITNLETVASIGRSGALLILSNLDLVNDLSVSTVSNLVPGGQGWILRAGRDLIVPLRGRMIGPPTWQAGGGNPLNDIVLRGTPGPALYGAMLSPVTLDVLDGIGV